MKRSVLILLVAILTTLTTAVARPVRLSVDLRPSLLNRKDISEIIHTPKDGLIDDSQLQMTALTILKALKDLGYPLASVDSLVFSSDNGVTNASLFISCGLQLTAIDEAGNLSPLNSELLEQSASDILDSLTDSGFPFARVTFAPKRPITAGNSLIISLQTDVSLGSFLRIGRIDFPGGVGLGEKYLLLESRLKIGQAFSRSDLSNSLERIERIPSITKTSEPSLKEISSGILEITIPVITRSSTRISGVAAITPGSSEPTGEFIVEVGNLFWGGRSASFAWYGLNPNQRGLKGSYHEGWIGGLPLALEGELEGWQTKSLHNRTTYWIGIIWEPYPDISLGMSGGFEQVAALSELNQSLNSTTRSLESKIVINRFDSDWNPSKGYAVTIENREGWRKFANGSGITKIQSGETKFEFAKPLSTGMLSKSGRELFSAKGNSSGISKWVGYFRVKNSFIAGKGLLADELPRFGGHSSVRGFWEDSFTGRSVLFGAVELRFRPNRHSGYFGLTGDWGWIGKIDSNVRPGVPSGSSISNQRFASSFGITTSFKSAVGIMSVDLTWPSGKPLEQSRLHVALTGWL